MAMNKWKMIWTNYDAVEVGEIDNASDRKFGFRLNKPNTIEFKVPMTDPMGRAIAMAPYGFGLVKLYKDNVLQMVAETTTLQVIGKQGERSVSVVATETMYPRFAATTPLLNSTASSPFLFPAGPAAEKFSQVLATIDNLYSVVYGNNGTTISAGTPGETTSVSASLFEAPTSFLDLLYSLAFRASGFDFWAEPLDPIPAAKNAYTTGRFKAQELRGSNRPNAAFEFGVGSKANVGEYTLTSSAGDHLANTVIVDGPTTSGGTPGVVGVSATSMDIFGPRWRRISSGIDALPLRQDLANLHVSKRGFPRIMYTMNPSPSFGDGNVPQFITDYDLGDIVPAKVKDEGIVLLDADVRIYGVIVSPDTNGMENVELELNPDTSA